MYFIVDSADRAITAHKSLGDAARAALKKLNVELPANADPVKLAKQVAGDRLVMLNASGAFDAIAHSDDRAAQELAADFKAALDKLYK